MPEPARPIENPRPVKLSRFDTPDGLAGLLRHHGVRVEFMPGGCDCPATRHCWNCRLTPAWAQTIRDLDTNPWTAISNAVRPIPQLEVWRRARAVDSARIDYALHLAWEFFCDVMGVHWFAQPTGLGLDRDAKTRLEDALRAAHPLSLAAEWGASTEFDFYGGDRG